MLALPFVIYKRQYSTFPVLGKYQPGGLQLFLGFNRRFGHSVHWLKYECVKSLMSSVESWPYEYVKMSVGHSGHNCHVFVYLFCSRDCLWELYPNANDFCFIKSMYALTTHLFFNFIQNSHAVCTSPHIRFICCWLVASYKHPCSADVLYIGTDNRLPQGHNALFFRAIAGNPLHALSHRHDYTWHGLCYTN